MFVISGIFLISQAQSANTVIENQSGIFSYFGTSIESTTFRNMIFRSDANNQTQFFDIALTNVHFENCQFINSDIATDQNSELDVPFANAQLTNVSFFRTTFGPGITVMFEQATLTNITFDLCEFHGRAVFEDVIINKFEIKHSLVGPRNAVSSAGELTFRRAVVDRLNIENSNINYDFGLYSTKVSDFSLFATNVGNFYCVSASQPNEASSFNGSVVIGTTFNGNFECADSSWTSGTFMNSITFNQNVNLSGSSIANIAFFGEGNGNAIFDASSATLTGGSLSITGFLSADFSGADFFNTSVDILPSSVDFDGALYEHDSIDTVNGTCCSRFCIAQGCECMVENVLPISEICLNATESPTPSVTPSSTPTPTVTPTVSISSTASATSTVTPTPSFTASPSTGASLTPTPSVTATISTSVSSTPSVSLSASASSSAGVGDGDEESTSDPNDGDGTCFPAVSTVRSATGLNIQMHELSHFTSVASSQGKYSDVFFFGHRHNATTPVYTVIHHTGPRSPLYISPGHYLYVNGSLSTSRWVNPGDLLRDPEGSDSITVERVSVTKLKGMYAPTTVSGDLVVDGVTVSCYTDALHPETAHKMLAPVRFLYGLGLEGIVAQFTAFDFTSWFNVARMMGMERGKDRY